MGASLTEALEQAITKSTEEPVVQEEKVEEPEVEEVEEAVDQDPEEDSEDSESSEEDEIEALAKEEDEEEEPDEETRYEKIIEDGVERKVSIDELKRGYQKASVSGKRFEEAAEKLKQAQAIENEAADMFEFMHGHPIAAMFEIVGEERASQALNEFHQDMTKFKEMSEAERENFLMRKDMEMRQARENFKQDKQRDVITDEQAEQIKQRLTPRIDKTLEEYNFKTGELKMRLLNKVKMFVSQHNTADLSLQELELLADQVKSETDEEWKSFLGDLEPEALVERLGEENVEKIRKYLLEKHRAKKAVKVEPEETPEEPKRKRRGEKGLNDYRNFFQDPTSF